MLALLDTHIAERPSDSALARADVLAQRFLHANDEAIAAISRHSEIHWLEEQMGLGWSAAAEASHLAHQ